MRAYVLNQLKSPLELEERERPSVARDEARIQLQAAALNRRDYWITRGMYPGMKLPAVLGSDGAGLVVGAGDEVDPTWIGQRVLINPGLHWGERSTAQSESFEILGMPRSGTFAEEIVVPASSLHRLPDHLDWVEGAAVPLAGVTAWRALVTQGGVQRGDRVLVTGIGGGVATFALQFALALEATVIVTSSSAAKRKRARELGAVGAYDYRSDHWGDACLREHGPIDLILDGAGGAGYQTLVDLAAPGGRIVNYGATAGAPPKLDLFKVFWKQLRLMGSTMGSPEDFQAMLEFVSMRQLRPVVDEVFPWGNVNDALDRMAMSGQFGKIVLRHNTRAS